MSIKTLSALCLICALRGMISMVNCKRPPPSSQRHAEVYHRRRNRSATKCTPEAVHPKQSTEPRFRFPYSLKDASQGRVFEYRCSCGSVVDFAPRSVVSVGLCLTTTAQAQVAMWCACASASCAIGEGGSYGLALVSNMSRSGSLSGMPLASGCKH